MGAVVKDYTEGGGWGAAVKGYTEEGGGIYERLYRGGCGEGGQL